MPSLLLKRGEACILVAQPENENIQEHDQKGTYKVCECNAFFESSENKNIQHLLSTGCEKALLQNTLGF